MKLTHKIILWFAAGALVLVGLYAWIQLDDELEAIRSERITELSAIARGAAATLDRVPAAAAEETLDAFEMPAPDGAGGLVIERRPRSSIIQRVEEADGRIAVIRPINATTELMVSTSTDELERVKHEAMVRTGIVMAAIALLGLLYASSVGEIVLGRPLRRLTAHFRRVGSGDLSPIDTATLSRDEVGELTRELAAMVARLSAARDQAEADHAARLAAVGQLEHAERLATIGKLASGVAHELGTPLNTIGGYAKMIATKQETGDAAAECARIVMEQADRTTAIVRQLLQFARRGAPTLVASDVRDCLERALAVAALGAKASRVKLAYERPAQPLVATIDDGRLQQVIVNLLNNAVQASPPNATVELQARTADHAIEIAVADHGQGIAAADLAHIFEPFFTTKPVGSGTGLGLSVSYGIVQDHGGRIDVASEPAKGSTFTVVLPTPA